MSQPDLVVRGATVVDGSGLPPYTADVAVRDGTITQVGRVDERGELELDGDGGVLAPGFVDIHTHYDAQLHWEPTASPSSWHGVTTVITGNCGFSLFPARAGGSSLAPPDAEPRRGNAIRRRSRSARRSPGVGARTSPRISNAAGWA